MHLRLDAIGSGKKPEGILPGAAGADGGLELFASAMAVFTANRIQSISSDALPV